MPLHGGVFLGGVLFMDDANPVLGLSVTQRYALGRDSPESVALGDKERARTGL